MDEFGRMMSGLDPNLRALLLKLDRIAPIAQRLDELRNRISALEQRLALTEQVIGRPPVHTAGTTINLTANGTLELEIEQCTPMVSVYISGTITGANYIDCPTLLPCETMLLGIQWQNAFSGGSLLVRDLDHNTLATISDNADKHAFVQLARLDGNGTSGWGIPMATDTVVPEV